MADIRIITLDGEKHIMRGNNFIGRIETNDKVYVIDDQGMPRSLGYADHPSEAVALVSDWLKRHGR